MVSDERLQQLREITLVGCVGREPCIECDIDDALNELQERRRDTEDARRWQPIETAPKDKLILLAGDGVVMPGEWQEGSQDGPDYMGCDDGFVDCRYDHFTPSRSFGAEKYRDAGRQPTHWMPLPPPPKEKAQNPVQSGERNHERELG